MNRHILTLCTLLMVHFYVQIFWSARSLIQDKSLEKRMISQLREELSRQELRAALQAEQYEEFRQSVATALPEAMRGVTQKGHDYPIRKIASIARSNHGENLRAQLASTMFETGKALFRKGEYQKANRLFEKVISRYGYLTEATEAYFLKAEGQYQLGDLQGSAHTIGQMVELYPDSELTGFAIVRLGAIFESQARYEEAVKMYRTAIRSFPYRSVATQAEQSLREMGR